MSRENCGLLLILVPSVSYVVAWNFEKRYYKTIYYYLLMGLITLYAAFSLTQGVFLFVNYIRGLPYEIEESAQ